METRSLSGYHLTDDKADFSCNIASATQPEQVRAYHAAWKACGADGLFLANMCYDTPRNRKMWVLDPVNPEMGERHFIVTYQDIPSGIVPNPYKPLPMKLSETCDLTLDVGRIGKENTVRIFIDFEGEEAPILSVDSMEPLNATPCKPVIKPSEGDAGVLLTYHTPLVYVPTSFVSTGQLLLHFAGQGIILYVEIQIS